MNYIKIFQNSEALSVSVRNSYSEYQMMHNFMDNFHQGGKYSAQIDSHQAEIRREEKSTDQKYLSISSLQTDYLNLDSSSCFGRNSAIANLVQTKWTFCEGVFHSAEKCFKMIRKEKEISRAAGHLDSRRTERTPRKCFRCGSEYHLIAKFPNPPKYNEKRRNHVRFNERGNCACDNGENNSDQKIYASTARMFGNDECPSGNFGDSLQLTNCILDPVATCHMTTEVSDFIPVSLEDTDKNIEVADGHHVTIKQKGQVQIKMCDDHGDTFISIFTQHNFGSRYMRQVIFNHYVN